MSTHDNTVRAGIASRVRRLNEIDDEIAEAKRKYLFRDDYKWSVERTRLLAERGTVQAEIVRLRDQTSAEYVRPRGSSVFYGSNS